MNLRDDAASIFMAGVRRVDPARLLDHALRLDGETLAVGSGDDGFCYDLEAYRHIVAVGMGKASAALAFSLERILGGRIDEGFVVTKARAGASFSRIRIVEGGHPVPDARSVEAGAEMLAIAEKVRRWEAGGERTLVVVLISGGGSALLCAPAAGITLADKAATTKLLLASGAPIQEMNAVRKHLSALKGGRLAEAFAPADILSLVISDVVGDDLSSIASGPTVPDSSTWESAKGVLKDKGIWGAVPETVKRLFEEGAAGALPDTPKADRAVFRNTRTTIVGSNMLALEGAAEEAGNRGYASLVLTSGLVGEAREAAKLFPALAADIFRYGRPLRRPACVLAGGETTVTLRGPGLGGRNQEMALAVLAGLNPGSPGHRELFFLSAGTDGNDGPTDAAGAFASMALADRAKAIGLDPGAYLLADDSYHFFERTDGLLKTGPTGTNVCDLQILLLP
jgi:hydroxypyruvate reductase